MMKMLTNNMSPHTHAQALKPAWEQAAKALRGIVAVGAADCDTHKEVAGEYRVQVRGGREERGL